MQKRFFVTTAVVLISISLLFAGDVAQFADIGFSPDGGLYMFGEYGVTDKKYEAYASIYSVDTAKNDFIPAGVFKTAPSAKTSGKSGAAVYADLLKTAANFIAANKIPAKSNSTAIYIAGTDADSSEQIEFRDFTASTVTNPVSYTVRLTALVEGSGVNTLSSFYFVIEKRAADGTVISRKIGGNPKIQRKGVTGYRIARILADPTGKNLVFVVEKQIADNTGTSIRYMVETVIL